MCIRDRYETSQGPIDPANDIVSTKKGEKIYLHFLNSKVSKFDIKNFDKKIKSLKYFSDNSKVSYKKKGDVLSINFNPKKIDSINTILTLVLK